MLLLCQSCSLWPRKAPDLTLPQQPASRLQQPALNMPQPDWQTRQVATAPQAATLPVSDSAKVVSYQKEDLTLLIRADLQLNRFQNNAHTLFMCIYQLKDPNAFNQLAEEKDGVPKLLECNRFDGSVANAKRIVVQPGQSMKDSRDRAEGARFIGIATGYFGSGKQKVTELAPLSVNNAGFSSTTIDVQLGPYEIERVTVK
jgi:predicted component of type VI protein secretion system